VFASVPMEKVKARLIDVEGVAGLLGFVSQIILLWGAGMHNGSSMARGDFNPTL